MTSLPRSADQPQRSVAGTLPDSDYAKRWSHVWGFVTALGVGLAALEWSPQTVFLGLVLDSTGVAVCAILVRTYLAPSGTVRVFTQHRRVGLMSLLAVAGVAALAAVAAVSPALALLTALSAILTSPLVVHHVHI